MPHAQSPCCHKMMIMQRDEEAGVERGTCPYCQRVYEQPLTVPAHQIQASPGGMTQSGVPSGPIATDPKHVYGSSRERKSDAQELRDMATHLKESDELNEDDVSEIHDRMHEIADRISSTPQREEREGEELAPGVYEVQNEDGEGTHVEFDQPVAAARESVGGLPGADQQPENVSAELPDSAQHVAAMESADTQKQRDETSEREQFETDHPADFEHEPTGQETVERPVGVDEQFASPELSPEPDVQRNIEESRGGTE